MAVDALTYKIEHLTRSAGESEEAALRRIVSERAAQGWELVEACGDEIRRPTLIFVQNPEAVTQKYLVETVPHVKGQGEVDDIRNALWARNDEGWMVLTVLDSPLSPPLAIYKQYSLAGSEPAIKVVIVPVGIFSNTAETVRREITEQEVRNQCRLRTVMHSGLAPVLIFLHPKDEREQEYLIEHAKGGLFSNQEKILSNLIMAHAKSGWRVCGAFEDESLLPCVIFCREIQSSD